MPAMIVLPFLTATTLLPSSPRSPRSPSAFGGRVRDIKCCQTSPIPASLADGQPSEAIGVITQSATPSSANIGVVTPSAAPGTANLPHDGTYRARVLLGIVAAFYGTNYAAVKLLDEWVGSPSEAAFMRFVLCALVLLPALQRTGVEAPYTVSWPLARDGLEIGVWMALGYISQAIALETSPATVQAFLLSLTVVVCPALESIFEAKRQPAYVWTAAALAGGGVFLLECTGHPTLTHGDLLGLLQPLFFGQSPTAHNSAWASASADLTVGLILRRHRRPDHLHRLAPTLVLTLLLALCFYRLVWASTVSCNPLLALC